VAALLHDVGKDAVAGKITNPLEAFTEEETAIAERHPVEGVKEMARSTTLNATTLRCMKVSLEHHAGPEGTGYPALGTEWSVEARSGGVCVIRVVHSLFASTDDWDNQLTSIESGWPTYFRILRLYLEHFQGQGCSNVQLMAMAPQPLAAAWESLVSALGLAGVGQGERWSTPAGVPPLAGKVEQTGEDAHRFEILRLNEPSPGIALLQAQPAGEQTYLWLNLYLYGDRGAAAAAQDEPLWTAWLTERFASLTPR